MQLIIALYPRTGTRGITNAHVSNYQVTEHPGALVPTSPAEALTADRSKSAESGSWRISRYLRIISRPSPRDIYRIWIFRNGGCRVVTSRCNLRTYPRGIYEVETTTWHCWANHQTATRAHKVRAPNIVYSNVPHCVQTHHQCCSFVSLTVSLDWTRSVLMLPRRFSLCVIFNIGWISRYTFSLTALRCVTGIYWCVQLEIDIEMIREKFGQTYFVAWRYTELSYQEHVRKVVDILD